MEAIAEKSSLSLSAALKRTKEERQQIASELSACLVTQHTYGKKIDDLELYFDIFMSDLKQFSSSDIAKALSNWRLKQKDFPTVADIYESLTKFETEAQRRKRLSNAGK